MGPSKLFFNFSSVDSQLNSLIPKRPISMTATAKSMNHQLPKFLIWELEIRVSTTRTPCMIEVLLNSGAAVELKNWNGPSPAPLQNMQDGDGAGRVPADTIRSLLQVAGLSAEHTERSAKPCSGWAAGPQTSLPMCLSGPITADIVILHELGTANLRYYY
jgi:hypothetical protein